MVDKVEIYWGADQDFEAGIADIEHPTYMVDIFNHINKTKVKVEGLEENDTCFYCVYMILVVGFAEQGQWAER